MRLHLIAGARPNFMKVAPVIHAIQNAQKIRNCISYRLVHTGQHYDVRMSETFFNDLSIPEPDINLGCGGGTQAEQTAAIMIAYENYLLSNPADLVIVVGDVTSTMACTIVAKKLNTKVAHVEAGIRSFDLTMPEEINRMVTDAITDIFFTTTELANLNLLKNGVTEDKIFFVGNVMIDTLLFTQHLFRKPVIWDHAGLENGSYFVITLHRPSNVDSELQFKSLLESINKASRGIPVIFPVHPRTAKIIRSLELPIPLSFHLTEPLGYLEFNYLVQHSMAVITDSGGITEETTVMGIPCITLRNSTERPETVTLGTNELIGTDPARISHALDKLFEGGWKKGTIPPLWDGNAALRIVDILYKVFC